MHAQNPAEKTASAQGAEDKESFYSSYNMMQKTESQALLGLWFLVLL